MKWRCSSPPTTRWPRTPATSSVSTPSALARPVQAAVTSAASFSIGALVPLLCVVAAGRSARVPACVAITLVALGALGAIGAGLGNAPRARGAWRVLIGGVAALAISFVLGNLVGAAV